VALIIVRALTGVKVKKIAESSSAISEAVKIWEVFVEGDDPVADPMFVNIN
jgi:hypothetical protein